MKKVLLAALLVILSFNNVFSAENFKILKSDQSSIILELRPFEIDFKKIELSGSRFHKIVCDKNLVLLNKSGFPQLPIVSVPLGIPSLSNPEIRVIESPFIDIPDIYLNPAPELKIEDNETDENVQEYYDPSQEIYRSRVFFPTAPAEFSQPQIIRDFKIVKLLMFPVQFNPSQKIIRHYQKLKVEIIYHADKSVEISDRNELKENVFQNVYEKLVVNYPVARSWRKSETKLNLLRQTTGWRLPQNPYYKLSISRNGVYHLTYNDLLKSGIFLAGIDSRTIKIFNRGVEVPLRLVGESDAVFEDTDFIEFYGQRNYSESGYYDDYSDTNVYWLTFGGENGKRLQAKNSLPGDYEELKSFRKNIHIEKDESYYHGDFGNIINTEVVSGEGWIWKEFFANELKSFPGYFDNVETESTELCSLKMRLRGMTLDPLSPDHIAQLTINNNLIGEMTFDNLENIVYQTTFPATVLRNGNNDFIIKAIDSGAQINKFYFDWLELSYPASFLSPSDEINFFAQKDQKAKISLWNLKSDSISIFNLSQDYYISEFDLKNEQRYIFKLLSAGFDDGNYSQIKINSKLAIDGGIRGHNIAVFDTSTGLLDEVRFFDTLEKTENSDSMAAFISKIPQNKLVLVAIRDEGSYSMTEAAYQAMESLGSAKTRQVGFRDSFVLLGRKGSAPGTVPELLIKQGLGQAFLVDTLYTYHSDSRHLEFNDQLIARDEFILAGSDSMRKPSKIVVDNFKNLRSAENSADYIFITHKKFSQIANTFSEYWALRNYRTMVVDVEDIYDEFNYGIKHAKAIKDFLGYSYQNWGKPAPTYVMLVGDASWDPKKNSPSSVKNDYIPVWGNPVSDNWFVCFDGDDDVLPDMFIGRLAIETVEQGETIFRKVEKYSELASANWKKQILFINGGFNDSEQATFGRQSQEIINNYVIVPPASCIPHVISKELDGLYEGEKREEINYEINAGKLWVNFIGHGGSGTWELMFHDEQVFQLENREHLPFVSSLTCHTGRFANPEITNFGENFVNFSDAGAVGFTGSSGWGFIYEDEIFGKKLFETILKDTVRQLGKALALAKIKFWGELYPNVRTESILYQYSLLGDPALELTLPKMPDLAITEKDIAWLPISPVEDDSLLTITVKIHNYGLHTSDSFQIKVTDNFNRTGQVAVFEQKIAAIGYEDSVQISLEVKNKPGEHLLSFILDPENSIIEHDETNNQSVVSIFVGSSRITISKPTEHQIVKEVSPILQINNAVSETKNSTYYFELDSTTTFDSIGLIKSGDIAEGTIVTNWRPPQLQPQTNYYWRCRRVEDNVEGAWISSDFYTGAEFGWHQNKKSQFKNNTLNGVETTTSGIRLEQHQIKFQVESSGFDDLNYLIVFVGSTPVSTATRGHTIAICDKLGNFLEARTFDTHDSQDDVAAMAQFLHDVPDGYFVLAGIRDSGEQAMTEAAFQALESIGSQYCRDVEFRDGWAIIGKKGAHPGSVPEKIAKRFSNEAAIVEVTLVTFNQSGSAITTEIGPSNGWKILSWEADSLSSETDLKIDVIALNKNSLSWDTLLNDLNKFSGERLSAIDSKIYPVLKLKATLISEDRLHSPLLKNWNVIYDPVSDLAISNEVVKINSDSLIEGALLHINADVYNVGYVDEDSVEVTLSFRNGTGKKFTICETVLSKIEHNNFVSYSAVWNTARQSGTNQLFLEIDPGDNKNELSENNNLVTKKVIVLADTTKPEIEVTYDGVTIIDQDYVASEPEIMIKVYDNSPAIIENDTTKFRLLLDGRAVNYSNNEQTISLMPLDNSADSTIKAVLRFTPHLGDGDHTLEIFAKDIGENFSYKRDEFKVISELKILKVLNYPNPFKHNTHFTFYLTQPVDRVVIKIFTVAGRLIHKIEQQQVGAGFQQIFWDGRDKDGDSLANGVYLYKIIVTANGKQKEKIEKLIVMR